MRRSLLSFLFLLPALLLAAGCSSGSSKKDTVLRVGVILPMSGLNSTYGEESWNGIQLAEEDIDKGTIDFPTPHKLILKDDKSDATEAGNQARELIETDDVHIILGSVASGNTVQIALVAKEAGVPVLTPASTMEDLTEKGGPLVSRICFKDSFQGSVLANFAIGQGWKKAAVVVDKGQDYSIGLAGNFKKVFEKRGGTVHFEYYTSGDTDFSNVIQNVANQHPDVIFISGYYTEGGLMIRQSKGKWTGIPIIGGDGLDSPDLTKLAGDTNATIYLSTHFAADAPDPRVRQFAERYKRRFKKEPGAMAALGYDVMLVLADAVKRCKDPFNRQQLAKAIASTKGVKGITGNLDLTTPDRTPIKDAVIVKVDNGLKYFKTIHPHR